MSGPSFQAKDYPDEIRKLVETMAKIYNLTLIDDPPKLAESLLAALLKPAHADALIGDLNERFADESEKFGRPRAVRLYWARTLRSLWPLLVRAISKASKWGAVIDAVRRHF